MMGISTRRRVRMAQVLAAAIMLAVAGAGTAGATPLDDYVAAPDDAYAYGPEPVGVLESEAGTAFIWAMASQRWRTPDEVDRPLWEHWVTIIVPKEVQHTTALLLIGGGGNGGEPPASVSDMLVQIATDTKSIVAELGMIPNQPIRLADEEMAHYQEGGRTEDALIAYAWDKFRKTGDPTWLPRLPMTKAVVRAMDLVQSEHPAIRDFVVAGGSKRGWTTWTTGAVEPRVKAIIPIVIDVVNTEHSMQHHWDAYGYWADAIGNYVEMRCMDWLHTPEFRALLDVVDPYRYLDRYTMPKYIMNATGDQFFLPDSSQFYFDELPGPKYLRYVPNTNHGMDHPDTLPSLEVFYYAQLLGLELPEVKWVKQADGALAVTASAPPAAVRLWQATNPEARNFRLDTIGEAWTSTDLEPLDDGSFLGRADAPERGWTAFVIELAFDVGLPEPFRCTTEVSVVPDTFPHRRVGGWGRIENVGQGSDAITLVHVGGDRYEMGYWYGRLLADQVAACWQALSAVIGVAAPAGALDAAIDALWDDAYFDRTAWEAELRGVADGCTDAGHPEVTYRTMLEMMAVPDLSEYNCSLFAAWGKATARGRLYQMRNLDWSMKTGIQAYPVVAIYHPKDGHRHAVIGFAGMVGAAGGGMNEHGLAVSEIMGHFGDAETLQGIPFPVLLRDVLYHDATLEAGLARMRDATRTNQYHYALAAPSARDPKARLLFTSHTRFDVMPDKYAVTDHPVENPSPFHEALNDVVYWKNHNGSGNAMLFEAIKQRYGAIDAEGAIEIAREAGVDGTLLSIVYANDEGACYVAFAEGLEPAHKQGYVRIDLNAPSTK